MRLAVKQTMMRFWLLLFTCCLSGLAIAAPDYVTAWPKQVQVEKPDPVLGNKPFWEHWVYSEAFAKRFKGFPIEKADPEMTGGIKAIVLRIFMRNVWQELNPDYPEQYDCEIDVYFDNKLSLPPTKSKVPYKPRPGYPNGISASYQRLAPYEEDDQAAIRDSQPVRAYMKKQPVIFAEPFDGRFAQFGVWEYRQSLAPGLSVISLLSGLGPYGVGCSVTAPLQEGGVHWLSLLGERPWDKREGAPPKAIHGTYDPRKSFSFDSGPDPESKGFFRVPEAFNKAALPKAALIKVLNWCIHNEKVGNRPIPEDASRSIANRCAEARMNGRILPDPLYHPGKETLQEYGY